LEESFTSKWWLSFKVEIWKCTKNYLSKLVGSMKEDFLFRLKSEQKYSEVPEKGTHYG